MNFSKGYVVFGVALFVIALTVWGLGLAMEEQLPPLTPPTDETSTSDAEPTTDSTCPTAVNEETSQSTLAEDDSRGTETKEAFPKDLPKASLPAKEKPDQQLPTKDLDGESPMKVKEKLSDKEVPLEVLAWLESERHREDYGAFFLEGQIYLAAKMGERPTGGFAINLGNIEIEDGAVIVRVEFESPSPWDMVTQAFTYPRAIVRVSSPNPPEHAIFRTKSNSVIAKVATRNLDID